MRILRSRPLATACLLSLAVSVAMFFLARHVKQIVMIPLIIGCLVFTVACLVGKKNSSGRKYSVVLTLTLCMWLMLVAAIGSAWHFNLSGQDLTPYADSDEPQRVQCTVLEENASGAGYTYYTVEVTRVNEAEINVRAVMECAYTAPFHVGDVIETSARICSLEAFYASDVLLYAVADGIRVGLRCEDALECVAIGHEDMSLSELFSRWRANLSARLLDLAGKKSGGLAVALFLGDRSYLDDVIPANFRRTGVSHLLALSGMHVTLLLGVLTSFLYRLRISKKGRIIILILGAILYLTLIGFRVSAVRAVGMILLMYLASLIGRQGDPLTTLCVIGFMMMTASPATVADGGFWMSFCAVFGLVTVMPRFNQWLQKRQMANGCRYVLQATVASSVALISVSFLSWLFCGEISLIGIPLTVLLTPLLSLILTWIPLLLLADLVPFFSAVPFALPLRAMLNAMNEVTAYFAHMRNVSVSLRIPFAGIVLAVMLAVLLVMMIMPLRRKLCLIIPPLIVVLLFSAGIPIMKNRIYGDHIQASYVVRSSGSMLVLSDPEGTALIDTSSGGYAMMRNAEWAAKEQGAVEIKYLVLTHYHRAFVYSTEKLAKRQFVYCVYLPLPQTEEEYAVLSAMKERLAPLGTEIRCYDENERLRLFRDLEFCLTDASFLERSIQPIITYTLQTPSEKMTYTTLSVMESEKLSTIRCILGESDILILGEHGPSVKEMTEWAVGAISPRLILIDSSDMLSLLEPVPENRPGNLNCITDITHYRFVIRK